MSNKTLLHSLVLLILAATFLSACGSKKQPKHGPININLEDAVIQQILNIRSKRNAQGEANTEALKTYLAVENPNHRYLAALSLASIQDSTAIEALADALKDPYDEVRRMAAFALGQTKSPAAAKILAEAFREDSVRSVQATILEAVGRCGTEKELKNLCVSDPYPLQDSLLQEGLALALYRFALRKMVQPEGTARIMNDFIANAVMSPRARFVAANYLARVPNLDLSQYESVLINNVQGEKDPNTLMFLVIGLAKTKSLNALKTLESCFRRHDDYRVRCNVIRGLHHFPYDSTKALVADALYDTSVQVQIATADYLFSYGTGRDALQYYDWAKEHPHWLVRTKLMGAAMNQLEYFKGNTKAFLSTKLTERYNECKNEYEKAEILLALSQYSWNYKFIANAMFPNSDTIKVTPIVKSAGATALVALYGNDDFEKEMGLSSLRVRDELHLLFRKCIESGDPGAMAVVAEAIADERYRFKMAFPDYQFLKEAQNKLPLPRDVETYILMQKAIDYLAGTKTSISDKGKNNFVEIDWPFIRALGPNPKVLLQTSKGRIVMQLLPDEAPATVMQFVQLVKAGYYNGKAFHRMVPNFVVQGGCSRGDGWGGFDVSVVSEFGQTSYNEAGRVGMASAGKDTESTQFFITHSPAIHLDGNYTIFAKVVEGLEVVHLLEVGDLIQLVELSTR